MPPFLQNLLALPAKTKGILAVTAVAILAVLVLPLALAGLAWAYELLAERAERRQPLRKL